MWRLFFALLVPTLLSTPVDAQGFDLGWTATMPIGSCNGFGNPAVGDGCAGAPAANAYTFQNSNFFPSISGGTQTAGSAQQSGQTYATTGGCSTAPASAVCHPPWAVAGVDYPVGPSCGSTCGFGNPGGPTDPTVSANLPAGCSYASFIVTCGASASISLGPLDFTAAGNSLGVDIGLTMNTTSGSCTLHDSIFNFDLAKTGKPGGSGGIVEYAAGGVSGGQTLCPGGINILNNSFKTHNSTTGTSGSFDNTSNVLQVLFSTSEGLNATTQAIAVVTTFKYNYFQSCPARCFTPESLVAKYNYLNGPMLYPTINGLHGDGWSVTFTNSSCGCSGLPLLEEQFDTWLMPAQSAGDTTCLACGNIGVPDDTVAGAVQFGSTQFQVTQASGSASTVSPQTTSFTASQSGTSQTVTAVGSGNGPYAGETITSTSAFTASQSGTSLNVTAISSNSIFVGMTVNEGSVTENVTAIPAGGGTGTYTVDQSNSVGSTSWTGTFTETISGPTNNGGGTGTYTASKSETIASTAWTGTYGLLTVGGTLTAGNTSCCGFQISSIFPLSGTGVAGSTFITDVPSSGGSGGLGTYIVGKNTSVASTAITIGTSSNTPIGDTPLPSNGTIQYGGLNSATWPYVQPTITACPVGGCSSGGIYTLSVPWVSEFVSSAFFSSGLIPLEPALTIQSMIVDHNVFVANITQTSAGSPSANQFSMSRLAGVLALPITNAQFTNNYTDVCGIGTGTATVPCPTPANTFAPFMFQGGPIVQYEEGNNVVMNNGICTNLIPTTEPCGVINTIFAPIAVFSPPADTNASLLGVTLKPNSGITPSITQGAKSTTVGGAVTLSTSPTVGDAAVVGLLVNNGSTSPPATVSCTDNATSGSNTYNQELANPLGGASHLWSYIFVAPLTRTNASSFAVTCTATGATTQKTVVEEATGINTGGSHNTDPTDLFGNFAFLSPTGSTNGAATPSWTRKIQPDLVWGIYFGSASSMTYGTSPFPLSAGPSATQGSGVFTENAVQ
jgi:hypothetical protein